MLNTACSLYLFGDFGQLVRPLVLHRETFFMLISEEHKQSYLLHASFELHLGYLHFGPLLEVTHPPWLKSLIACCK